MYLDGIAAGSSLGLVGPSSDSFLGFRICIVSGNRKGASEISETLSDKPSGISAFAGLRGNQRCAGVNTLGKKNGQESLPLRKANPGRLAALWIGVLCGSGNHLLT